MRLLTTAPCGAASPISRAVSSATGVRSLQQDCVGRVLVTTRHRLTDMAEARQLTKPNFSIGYSHRKFRANRADIGA
jgi:hypothetical protein